jgi:hypothetical protein
VAQASTPASSGGVSPPSPQRHRDGALTRSRDGLRYIQNVNALSCASDRNGRAIRRAWRQHTRFGELIQNAMADLNLSARVCGRILIKGGLEHFSPGLVLIGGIA